MRKQKVVEGWVVYKSKHAGPGGSNAVCELGEWAEMEAANPGEQTLVQTGIASEAEAERLARASPGGTAEKAEPRLKARL